MKSTSSKAARHLKRVGVALTKSEYAMFRRVMKAADTTIQRWFMRMVDKSLAEMDSRSD
jgi:hypothetical protein